MSGYDLDVARLVSNPSGLRMELMKTYRLRCKDENFQKYLRLPYPVRFIFPGIFKASLEAEYGLVSFGNPIIENTIFFMEDAVGGPLNAKAYSFPAVPDEKYLGMFAENTIKSLDKKYSYSPSLYAGLPISMMQCVGFKNNYIFYYDRVWKKLLIHKDIIDVLDNTKESRAKRYEKARELLKINESFESIDEYIRGMFRVSGGLFLDTLGGIFETVIGVIPLVERNLIALGYDDRSHQIAFQPKVENPVVKRIWSMLEPYATGSKLLSAYINLTGRSSLREPSITFWYLEPYGDFNIVRKVEEDLVNSIREFYEYLSKFKSYVYGVIEGFKNLEYLDPFAPNLLVEYMQTPILIEEYSTQEEFDKVRKMQFHPILEDEVKEVIKRLPSDYVKKLKRSDHFDIVSEEERKRVFELWKKAFYEKDFDRVYELDTYIYFGIKYLKFTKPINDYIVERARELYNEYFERLKEVKEILEDMRARELTDREWNTILAGVGQSYLTLMKTFYPSRFSPFLIAEAGYLYSYLKTNYNIKQSWRDILRLGSKIMRGNTRVLMGRRRFGIFRKEERVSEDEFNFYWMRYQRALDNAKNNLDMFERFKQRYYLNRALDAYEDAKRVLYDMMSRFRRDKKRYEKIVNEMILLESQINDLKEFMKKAGS